MKQFRNINEWHHQINFEHRPETGKSSSTDGLAYQYAVGQNASDCVFITCLSVCLLPLQLKQYTRVEHTLLISSETHSLFICSQILNWSQISSYNKTVIGNWLGFDCRRYVSFWQNLIYLNSMLFIWTMNTYIIVSVSYHNTIHRLLPDLWYRVDTTGNAFTCIDFPKSYPCALHLRLAVLLLRLAQVAQLIWIVLAGQLGQSRQQSKTMY